MTGITRPCIRCSDAALHSLGRRRLVIVELRPDRPAVIGFRLKGTRKTYYLPIDHCYREALRAELARLKAERKAKRKERACA